MKNLDNLVEEKIYTVQAEQSKEIEERKEFLRLLDKAYTDTIECVGFFRKIYFSYKRYKFRNSEEYKRLFGETDKL